MQEKLRYSKSFKPDLVCIISYFLVDITSLLKNGSFKNNSSEEKKMPFEIIDFCNVAYIFSANIFSANTRLIYCSKMHGAANT